MPDKRMTVINGLTDDIIKDEEALEAELDKIIDPDFSKKLDDFLEGLTDELVI